MPEWESVNPSQQQGETPDPTTLTPVDVEKRLLELVDSLSEALVGWKNVYKRLKTAEHDYDQVYAAARLKAADDGVTANDRRYHADLDDDVIAARQAMDLAEVSFKYAEERLKGVHAAIRAWQSVGTSVRQAYQGAG